MSRREEVEVCIEKLKHQILNIAKELSYSHNKGDVEKNLNNLRDKIADADNYCEELKKY